MTPARYQIRQCQNPDCGLRYPLTEGHPFGERCPRCLGATKAILARSLSPTPFPASKRNSQGRRLEALLDNLRSAWNVGAIFRSADGFGVDHLYLCGITPTPENESVRKTALGAENSVGWSQHNNALVAVQTLKNSGRKLWALEQDPRAVTLSSAKPALEALQIDEAIVLVVGNEISGVDPGLLALCERVFYIPMRGQKRSLNVEVAFGIFVSQLADSLP